MPVVFEKEIGKGTEGCGLFRYSLRHDCKFIIILSQYIIFSSGRYTFRASSRFLPSPPHPLKTIAFIPSGAKTQKIKRIDHRKCNVRASKNADQAYFLSSSSLLTSPPHPLKTIAFIPSGAKTQKIKRIDHRKCNVRASKNAG